MSEFAAIIGLECHAQLATRSKLFCACAVESDAEPNANVCPICLGHPGTLPTVNAAAVQLAVRAALALGCTLHRQSEFARKHYFYPDLPKGYQITQADRPLATGGAIHVGGRPVRIHRLHLEEDSGKMLHSDAGSLLDWNRAGVPLIEVVGEAELHTADDAEAYLRTLHRVLVEGGICPGDLEKGHFRCDANVSVHRPGDPWGTKVEIKNVNSFRFVARAIRYEVERQARVLASGGIVEQETRTWAGNKTVVLRKKEGAADYRYLREPDLRPLVLAEAEIDQQRAELPGVPLDRYLAAADAAEIEAWVVRYGLTGADARTLLANAGAAQVFVDAVQAGGNPKVMAHWVMGEVLRREHVGLLTGIHLHELQALVDAGALNRDAVKRAIEVVWEEGGDVTAVVSRLGLGLLNDPAALGAVIAGLLAGHPREHQQYREGNRALLGFFMGKLMASTQRRADPELAQRLLVEALQRAAG